MEIRRVNNSLKESEAALEILYGEIYDDISRRLALSWMRGMLNPVSPFVYHFIAVEGDKVVGTIVWVVDDFYGKEVAWRLLFVAVDEKHQRKGIGRRLVKESFADLQKNPDPAIAKFVSGPVVVVTDGYNKGAIAFYRSFGPFRVTRVQKFWRKDAQLQFFFRSRALLT